MIHLSSSIRFTKQAALFPTFLILLLFSGMISYSQTTCDTWLYVYGDRSGVETDGPNITGNQLTVEALFNRTQSFDPIGHGGDLVSKHGDPSDVNYLLRPYGAFITTDQGFFGAVDPNGANSISLNTTYHVAMVYNGATLSLYRNGNLIAQVPASGNLVTNSLPVHIGTEGYLQTPWPVHFYGYINEVRIWNVARSQAAIQTYMNSTLPNPSSQTGLLAYYTFNNTSNKAINTAYNGFVFNQASIHQSNPNAVTAICENEVAGISCNSYLKVNANQSGVQIGDLDISGNQMTVEAVFNSDSYNAAYGGGDVVSKHCGPSDVNYLVRPNLVAITTTNGYYQINAPCDAVPGITYYIALVYNGQSLQFYRNWELMGEIQASGNLINNNWLAKIGWEGCSTSLPIDFKGYINEVRIWNIALAQNDLLTFYRTTLPNPMSTPGLQAYYTFNSLANKQGNAAWNGTIFGNATINETAPICLPDNGYTYACGWYRRDVSKTVTPSKGTVPDQPLLPGQLSIYPNPAKGTVKLEYNADNNATVIIKVLDVTGKTGLTMNRTVIAGINTITANVSNLANGMYFVQFINGSEVQTKKLIISK